MLLAAENYIRDVVEAAHTGQLTHEVLAGVGPRYDFDSRSSVALAL